MSNFPDYQGQHTEQNQCEGEYIGKEDQKAVLEEGVPVVDSASIQQSGRMKME